MNNRKRTRKTNKIGYKNARSITADRTMLLRPEEAWEDPLVKRSVASSSLVAPILPTRPSTSQGQGGRAHQIDAIEFTPSGSTGTSSRTAPSSIPSNPHTSFYKPRGTGRVFPSKFEPNPSIAKPMQLFTGRLQFGDFIRFTLRGDHRTCLIFTDGACLGNGGPNPQAGWAFVHGPRAGEPNRVPHCEGSAGAKRSLWGRTSGSDKQPS
ncbi:hypothetical protein M427DRAFT_156326 [Gonapodya prolifera JEL478]|uniref:RNase H type-1 domain-containing protein n=1 Tax=Gonapodya prolifera (strain JEL478) TaxID=1344416 RepID=A0A139AAP1_GONPJ|nr:hypothetical protein M427DRAFT_156326 [Gonapodya prolifera JEL478]|eukprot:KXS13891.1 hypothetical protein M427DRAFT_156326 [Gonapodya prolifera JEL478]